MDEQTKQRRQFLKNHIHTEFDFSRTDQAQGVPVPPAEKPPRTDQRVIELPGPKQWETVAPVDLTRAIRKRRSRRIFKEKPMRVEELAFLLWATQGVVRQGPGYTMRTVPSAGARHALETYVCALHVAELPSGVYRYLPTRHALAEEFLDGELGPKLAEACLGQRFLATAGAVWVWTAVPYRMEWRYGPVSAKAIALDTGHAGQNLYLACEAVDCGTCAIGAYDQKRMDALIRADGEDEFVVYLAPVGKAK
ncbi:MAG: SagB/ThcOx family dehydrogenase [Candidatus Omnitrophica bacterium]|nr:SagB/ThcOx family dehydrogenase [Candidatus Omnitrophota bacterium]